MITQIEQGYDTIQINLFGFSWIMIPDSFRTIVSNGMQLTNNHRNVRYFSQMIIEQQQCINLSLRDVVNDWLSFKRSMFL